MKMNRKRALAVLLCLAMVLAASTLFANGQNEASDAADSDGVDKTTESTWKPKSTVEVIVTFGAGGGMDTIARAIASFIDLDGQTMYITNVSGGGGTIGIMEGYHSEPDGHTLMIGSPEANVTNYISGSLEAPANKDMVYICSVAYDMNILCVAPGTYTNWAEFKSAAETSPGKLNIASVGSMNSMQASITDVLMQADIDCNYVPYDGAAASRTAIMGKNADAWWGQLSEAKPYIESGELVALAIAGNNRATEIIPEIPTFKELGVNTASGIHRSMLLPPGASPEIAAYYEAKIKEVYDNPQFIEIIQGNRGYAAEWEGTADMASLAAEIQSWGEKMMSIIMH